MINYPNEHYSRIEGKSLDELYLELRAVYENYREYNDADDFYKLHFVAQAFLEQLEKIAN
jgi:hypothetical protein